MAATVKTAPGTGSVCSAVVVVVAAASGRSDDNADTDRAAAGEGGLGAGSVYGASSSGWENVAEKKVHGGLKESKVHHGGFEWNWFQKVM